MTTRIRNCDIHLVNLQTRMPFKYGIATMTRVPHAFVRVEANVNGHQATGISADLLPPKWFTKDPDKPLIEEVHDMLRAIRNAAQASVGLEAGSAFEVWRQLDARQSDWGQAENLPPLLTNFGTSLVERALIEAVARACATPLSALIQKNVLGIDLGQLHPPLRDHQPGDLLSSKPLKRIVIRHTVGLLDPLRDDQIPHDQKLHDGLPQSFAACIRFYQLHHFKVKVTGHLDHDLDRLQQIAEVIHESGIPDYRFTLDGNEQFRALRDFRSYWEAVEQQPTLKPFLEHLLFVEQPLHRGVALDPDVGALLQDWPDRPPIIIDESDATLESLPAALALGYAGTSHKNCKGIFKGIGNRCLLAFQSQTSGAKPAIMSGEDLCTIGPISVIQDLAVMAALGIESVERNGHHYFPGLSMFSKPIQEEVLAAHSDLYCRSEAGWPRLDIRGGTIDLDSLNRAPFGVGFTLDPVQFTPIDEFKPIV